MTDSIDRDGFRANVGIIVSNERSELLLAGRAGQRGWQFPQGGINPHETPQEAMFRELREEIGLYPEHVEVLGTTDPWLRYRLPHRYRRDTRPICVGQKQIWFLLRLLTDETALVLDNCSRPEFDRWRWVGYWQPVIEVIYFKKRVYERALEQLGPLLFPDGVPPPPRRRRSRNPARLGGRRRGQRSGSRNGQG